MDMDALEDFDLFIKTINESMIRSSSPLSSPSTTLNYSDSNAPKTVPSSKKTRAYKRKNTSISKTSSKKNSNKKKTPKKKSSKWFAGKDNNFANSVSPFTGSEKVNIDITDDSLYAFFNQIFSEKLFEHITFETNRYASQCNKPSFKITVKELKLFFVINIAMTCIKYPNVRMYWSSVEGIRMNLIADTMPVNRFSEIKRFLHFEDNSNKPLTSLVDTFWKLRPVINMLHTSFHAAASADEHIAIDEMMVPFKGRSHLKQYLKSKPKKWGFKVWVQANTTGYVNCFDLYQGSSNEARSTFGPIGDTVIKFMIFMNITINSTWIIFLHLCQYYVNSKSIKFIQLEH